MLEINPKNMNQIKDEFLSFFDSDFISEIISFDILGTKKGFQLNKVLSNTHPLALKWKNLCSDIVNSEAGEKMIIGPDSLHILQLHALLLPLSETPNFKERIIERLSNKSSYYSTYYEVVVAASYVERGYSVEIVVETPDDNKKSCDFIVSTSLGKVMVEAKSLNDPEDKQQLIHEELDRLIRKTLMKHKRCYIVSIKARNVLELTDIEKIINKINTDIESDNLTVVNNNLRSVSITYKSIGAWDTLYNDIEINNYRMSEFGNISWDLVHNKGVILGHKNPTGFELFPVNKIDRLNTIINNLRTAKKQLTHELPAIVHVEVKGNPKVFHQTLDQCFDSVYRNLAGNFKSINAVVFENQYYNHKPLHENDIIIYQNQVIAGKKSKFTLPEDFSLCVKQPAFNANDLDQARTVSFDIKLDDFENDCYREIFWKSTPDGLNQVRAYIVPNGRFRFEVIQSKFGRHYIEEDLSIIKHIFHEKKTEWNKLTFTWGKKYIHLFINLINDDYDHMKIKKY